MQAKFTIHPEDKLTVLAKLDILNRRAIKLGVAALTITWSEEYSVKSIHPHTGAKIFLKRIDGIITGESIKLNGWKFIATLLPIAQDKSDNIIKTAGLISEVIPVKYRTSGTFCEHCKQNRYRKETFLCVHEDNTIIQIGRSCLKDFLGHSSPEALASLFQRITEFVDSFKEPSSIPKNGNFTYSLEEYLTLAAAVVRVDCGYKSAKNNPNNSTISKIKFLEGPSPSNSKDLEYWKAEVLKYTIIPKDLEVAKEAITWILSQEDTTSDYIYNMKLIASTGEVSDRNKGIMASLLYCLERALAEKEDLYIKSNEWLGTVKERSEKILTLKKTNVISSFYGDVLICNFEDLQGNVLIWFCTSFFSNEESPVVGKGQSLEIGTKYKVKCTIKDHKEYGSRKQTIISRCILKELQL